jgi:hypothetical protein
MVPIGINPEAMIQNRKQSSQTKLKPLLVAGLLVPLAALVWFSFYLSQSRIYQVDECMNVYMARILSTGQASQFFTNASLFLLGPLSWITRHATSSATVFSQARVIFLFVFWLNLWLMASIVGGRIGSLRWLTALLAAATLAPLWDYGFEIRHDNLVLCGVLLIWWTIRVKPLGLASYVLTGMITVALLFVAVKSVVYVVPLSCAVLVFPPAGHKQSRLKLIAAWIGGALLATLIIRICYGTSGAWDTYLNVFRGVAKYSASSNSGESSARFWPWKVALPRLLYQTPLLLALIAAGFAAVAARMIRNWKSSFTWDSNLPEALLLLGAFGDLMINPSPYPYNLVHLVPYAFLFAFRYAADVWLKIRMIPIVRPVVAGVVIFLYLWPFIAATQRHLDFTNDRQKKLMTLAEQLTDPARDQVYDGIGMVPTRQTIHYQWYIHSLNLNLLRTHGTEVHEILTARPAAVFIPSYRTDWLPKEDREFINTRYVALANDFTVLGKILPPGGGSFEIFHAGRYCVVPAASLGGTMPTNSAVAINDPVAGSLDGVGFSNNPVELTVGTHRLESAGKTELAVVWVGPNLERVPLLVARHHDNLFRNWY